MLMSSKFKAMAKENGTLELSRTGVATSVVIPEELKKRTTYEANVVDGKIVFSEGDSVYVIADQFGFVGGTETEVETNFFFIDGGIVFELISGKIALKGENGEIYTVDETGDIEYPRANARIDWKTTESIMEITKIVVRNRYSTNEELTLKYANNLVMNTVFFFENTSQGYVFSSKYHAYYEDLGGSFEFINFGENIYVADEDTYDVSELVDKDDEDEEVDTHNYKMDGEEEEEEALADAF